MKYSISICPESHTENTKLLGFVKYSGKRIKFQIGRVDADSPEKWNSETARCMPRTKHGRRRRHAALINADIDKFINSVDSFFIVHAGDETPPPSEEFKRFVKSRMDGEENPSDSYVLSDYKAFIRCEAEKIGWSLATIKKHNTFVKDLEAVAPHLKYSDITPAFYTKLINYLNKKKNRTGTVKMKISLLEWFLRWAEENNKAPHINKESRNIKLKTVERPVIFLSWEELMRVYALDLSDSPHLERAKDVFIFQCFTGLRYSDVKKLKKIHIYDDAVHVLTQKTHDALTIELNRYSRAIIEKYKDFKPDPLTMHHIPRSGAGEYEYALPVISSQGFNKYIKEFVKLAQVDTPVLMPYFIGNTRFEKSVPKYELITSHAARRTFICAALSLGVPTTTVMKWSGHKSFDSMKPYVDVSSQEKRDAMSLFDKISAP